MPTSIHRIRWKGRTDGPFSREEIRARLADGELSLLHRVEVDGKWISLGDFLTGAARPGKAAFTPPPGQSREDEEAGRDLLHKLGYFLCGLCFVLPFLATAGALIVATRLNHRDDRATAHTQITLAVLFSLLGLAFWAAVFIARARGLL